MNKHQRLRDIQYKKEQIWKQHVPKLQDAFVLTVVYQV